jgi:hypothetical protein
MINILKILEKEISRLKQEIKNEQNNTEKWIKRYKELDNTLNKVLIENGDLKEEIQKLKESK